MTPEIVWIRWHDAMSATSGWAELADAKEFAREAWDNPIHGAGFLIDSTDEYVVVATGYNPQPNGDPEVTGAIMVPRSEIISITTVAAAWEQER